MSDNSDRSDSDRSISESSCSDSEYSSNFSSEDEGSEAETPLADSPETIKDSRPAVKVETFDIKSVPPIAEVNARRNAVIKPYKAKRKEAKKLANSLDQGLEDVEKIRTFIVNSMAALSTLNDQERFFHELITTEEREVPGEPNFKFLLKLPDRETEKSVKSLDECLNSFETCHNSLKKLKNERFKSVLYVLKRALPAAYENVSKLANDFPGELQAMVETLDSETSELEPASDVVVEQLLRDLIGQFQADLDRFDKLQEKYPSLTPNTSKYTTTQQMVDGLRELMKKIDKSALEVADTNSRQPRNYDKYLLKKNPKQEYFGKEENHKTYKRQQQYKNKKLDMMDCVDDGYVDVATLEKKLYRVKTLIEKYKKEQMILDKGVDAEGNQIVNIPQDLLDRVKEDIALSGTQADELEEELNRIKEQGKMFQKEEEKRLQESKNEVTDDEAAPIVMITTTSINQIAYDIKLLKKEYQRLADLEKYQSLMLKELEDHVAAEKIEIEASLQLKDDEHERTLADMQQVIVELEQQCESLPELPSSAELFRRTMERATAQAETMKPDMLTSIDNHQKVDAEIEEFESKLDKYTEGYDKHIRIELDEPLLVDYEKGYSENDAETLSFFTDQAEEKAAAHLEAFKKMSEEERQKQIEEFNVYNEKAFHEVVKMNEVLLFLEDAAPEEKKKFYTKEADRRVRFTKHCGDRLKELDTFATVMIDVHSKTDEALSNRYDAVSEWIANIDKKLKMQEEKTSEMFNKFLNEAPMIKKQAAERKETILEVERKLEELQQFDEKARLMEDLEDETWTTFGEFSEDHLEGAQFYNVELQLEIDDLVAKGEEFDALIEREEERLKELEKKESASVESQRKIGKRLTKAEIRLVEARNKQEEREKIEKYGSIDEMLKVEIERLKDLTTCSNCKVEPKSAIITKCCHIFCLNCIENLVTTRNRRCPKCKGGFGANDYQKIYLGSVDP